MRRRGPFLPLTERVAIRISPEERELVEHYARIDDRSVSNWIRIAIRQRLQRIQKGQ